jgi:hypothetical protein
MVRCAASTAEQVLTQYCTKAVASASVEKDSFICSNFRAHSPALVHEAAHSNVHHDPQCEEGEENRRPPVTQQRQRNASDGHKADDHPDVDRNLKDDDGDNPHDDEAAGQVRGRLGVLNQPHKDKKIQQQHTDRANESVLLAEGREDEVGVGDGQEVTLGLGAAVGALTPDAARAHRDQRLSDLVARTFGVGVGVDEGVDARLLIRLQSLPALPRDTSHQRKREQDQRNLLDANAAEEKPGNENREVGERCAEIRLDEHQHHGNTHQSEGLADVRPRQFLAGEAPEVARNRDDQDQLYPLRRLEVSTVAEVDPAPCAENLGAHQLHCDQRSDTDANGPRNDVDQDVVVNQRDEEHQHQAECEELDLLMVEAVEFGVQRRGLDLENRDDRKQKDEAQKDPIEVAVGGEAGHGR